MEPSYLDNEPTRYHGHSGWHEQMINGALLQRTDDDVICQMVADPSFKAYEAAIYLRRRDTGWEVVAR